MRGVTKCAAMAQPTSFVAPSYQHAPTGFYERPSLLQPPQHVPTHSFQPPPLTHHHNTVCCAMAKHPRDRSRDSYRSGESSGDASRSSSNSSHHERRRHGQSSGDKIDKSNSRCNYSHERMSGEATQTQGTLQQLWCIYTHSTILPRKPAEPAVGSKRSSR